MRQQQIESALCPVSLAHRTIAHLVSFPDPFCARARNLKLGGGERPGKGSGKSSNGLPVSAE